MCVCASVCAGVSTVIPVMAQISRKAGVINGFNQFEQIIEQASDTLMHTALSLQWFVKEQLETITLLVPY